MDREPYTENKHTRITMPKKKKKGCKREIGLIFNET